MSKKSRRRNKKLLMLAALAGGAALMGRNKRIRATDSPGDAKAAAVKAMTSDAAYKTPTTPVISKPDTSGPFITKKPADDSWLDVPKGPHGAGGKAEMWRRIKDAQYEKGEHYTPNLNPYTPPKPNRFGRAVSKKGGRIGAKKGGSVTGAAKRGFGRALMKGKK
jgi:hypothetical protein